MAILDFLSQSPRVSFTQFLKSGFGTELKPDAPKDEKTLGKKSGGDEYYYTLPDQVRKLPFVHQAADLKARIIFSQGMDFRPKDRSLLESGSRRVQTQIEEDKEKLWELFNRKNDMDESLAEQLYTTVVNTELYGHRGLQAYQWESPETIFFQTIDWNQFFIVANKLEPEDKGQRRVLYYLISLSGARGESGAQRLLASKSTDSAVKNGFQYRVIPHEFVLFKLNMETPYGVSPLYYDQLSKQLLLDALGDNISEVNNEGYKGVIIKGRSGINPRDFGIARDSIEMNTDWLQTIVRKYMSTIKGVISGNKNRENVIYVPGALAESVQQLDRAIKSTDYLDFIQAKGAVLAASMLGIHPGFLGEKDSTYASNLSEAIKFAATYSIEPSQIKYEGVINTQILDRYINGTGYLNYEYEVDIKSADTADREQESRVYNELGNFIVKLKQEGITSGNESARFLNEREIDGLNIEEDDESGDVKTTIRPLYPVGFKDVEEEEKIDEGSEEDSEKEGIDDEEDKDIEEEEGKGGDDE